MIAGSVNKDLEAVVDIAVQDDQGELHNFQCVLDTGFDGFIALPEQVVQRLGLVQTAVRKTFLVDDLEQFFPLYWGIVNWCGETIEVSVLGTTQEFMVGMALLENSTLTIEVWDGGEVLIEPRQAP